jgi:hypothetical protein
VSSKHTGWLDTNFTNYTNLCVNNIGVISVISAFQQTGWSDTNFTDDTNQCVNNIGVISVSGTPDG